MRPLKEMIDQFDSEGVLVSGNSCDFDCPLIIVNIKDGGIRMAVDYRDVNLQLESTTNPPYQPSSFQRLGGQHFFQKLTIYGVNTNSVCQEIAQRSLLLSIGNISLFGMSIWYLNCPGVNIRQG